MQSMWASTPHTSGAQTAYSSQAAVALLRDLEGTGTTRNWSTVEKINALLQRDSA
jgi:uncharacterized protein (DUF1697 family)